MTINELEDTITSANWFSHLGEFRSRADTVSLVSITDDERWDWLPTSRDQEDPIHGDGLRVLIDQNGKGAERREAELRALKAALKSIRSIETRVARLVEGPHDYNIAAQSAAQFAARMAAREIIAEKCGFWCSVVKLYSSGFWPCGLTEEGKLIIY
ncbi:hypothetical protein [Polaromonas hydrogenivorans]|uniref:Uncharacterized protein n=1 Tax=Polaromonas hydrogenivorans TaxID=335476 RepID=A0AAU7LVQ3_9BURK